MGSPRAQTGRTADRTSPQTHEQTGETSRKRASNFNAFSEKEENLFALIILISQRSFPFFCRARICTSAAGLIDGFEKTSNYYRDTLLLLMQELILPVE